MLNQYGEERNQEIEDDETRNKIVGEIPERQELFNEVVGGYGLVARNCKNDEDDPNKFKLILNQEDNEFLQLKNYILTLENNLKNQQEENNDDYDDELDFVGSQIAELIYYKDTKK